MQGRTRVLGAGLWILLGLLPGLLAQPRPVSPDPIRILHADRFPIDRGQNEVLLEGHVQVQKGKTLLSGATLRWLRQERTLEIQGDVLVKDDGSQLTSEHLLYDMAAESVTAWGNPRLAQWDPKKPEEKNLMTAVQLRLYPKAQRVEAIEDVRIERRVPGKTGAEIEIRIQARVAEITSNGRRVIVKGDVVVETPEIRAQAGRMVLEQETRQVLLFDGVVIWNYDSKGEPLDELRGDKVVHFLDESRTIALGSVRATVHPETQQGRRVLGSGQAAGSAPGRKTP